MRGIFSPKRGDFSRNNHGGRPLLIRGDRNIFHNNNYIRKCKPTVPWFVCLFQCAGWGVGGHGSEQRGGGECYCGGPYCVEQGVDRGKVVKDPGKSKVVGWHDGKEYSGGGHGQEGLKVCWYVGLIVKG